MKKVTKFIIAGAAAVIVVAAGVIVKQHVTVSQDGSSITIIGGANGPTSIFLAGKLSGGENKVADFTSISMEEAKEKFKTKGDYMILDVRRPDEYAQGHIPGAINLANESITDTEPAELMDKDQTIYVYCRSGNRSRQASAKLAAMGYSNIIECGGIMDWTGELE